MFHPVWIVRHHVVSCELIAKEIGTDSGTVTVLPGYVRVFPSFGDAGSLCAMWTVFVSFQATYDVETKLFEMKRTRVQADLEKTKVQVCDRIYGFHCMKLAMLNGILAKFNHKGRTDFIFNDKQFNRQIKQCGKCDKIFYSNLSCSVTLNSCCYSLKVSCFFHPLLIQSACILYLPSYNIYVNIVSHSNCMEAWESMCLTDTGRIKLEYHLFKIHLSHEYMLSCFSFRKLRNIDLLSWGYCK